MVKGLLFLHVLAFLFILCVFICCLMFLLLNLFILSAMSICAFYFFYPVSYLFLLLFSLICLIDQW